MEPRHEPIGTRNTAADPKFLKRIRTYSVAMDVSRIVKRSSSTSPTAIGGHMPAEAIPGPFEKLIGNIGRPAYHGEAY